MVKKQSMDVGGGPAVAVVVIAESRPRSGSDRTPSSPQRQYLYGVQGLRTVAALMVAVYHIWFHRVSGGVDVFFVVAGYFAAGSLLKVSGLPTATERLAGVGHYLLRTARRVIPSATVVVVGTVVAALLFLPRSQWPTAIPHGWASLGFWENWYLIHTGNDYLQQGLAASPFQQFWALSIQVQSYVLFPLLALLAAAAARVTRVSQRRMLFLMVAAVFVASLTYSAVLTTADQPTAYFHLGTRLWEFSAGTILALVLRKPVGNKMVMRVLGWVGLLAIVSFAAFADASQLLPGLVALVPVGAGAAIIAAAKQGVEPSILKARPMLWFADSSFAFYLWHWPILVFYRVQFQEAVSLKAGIVILLLAALLAVATTSLVEKPFRSVRRLQESAAASIIACLLMFMPAAAALAVWNVTDANQRESDWQAVESLLTGNPREEDEIVPSTAIARQDTSEAYERRCQQWTTTAEVITCVWGNEASDTTIALVGASHSTQWIDLVAATADELGVKLVTMTKGACPFGDVTRAEFPVDPSCPVWMEEMLGKLVKDPPDLVVTVATRPYGGVEQVPTWKLPYFQRLSAAGIPVLGLRDNPRFEFDVPACIETKGVDACTIQRSDALIPLETLDIPELPHFTFLDTADDFCNDDTCPPVIDGVLVSWDGSHLTKTWTLVNGGRVRDAIAVALDSTG